MEERCEEEEEDDDRGWSILRREDGEEHSILPHTDMHTLHMPELKCKEETVRRSSRRDIFPAAIITHRQPFWHYWLEGHLDGHDYLLTNEESSGLCVLQLDTGLRSKIVHNSLKSPFALVKRMAQTMALFRLRIVSRKIRASFELNTHARDDGAHSAFGVAHGVAHGVTSGVVSHASTGTGTTDAVATRSRTFGEWSSQRDDEMLVLALVHDNENQSQELKVVLYDFSRPLEAANKVITVTEPIRRLLAQQLPAISAKCTSVSASSAYDGGGSGGSIARINLSLCLSKFDMLPKDLGNHQTNDGYTHHE